MVDKMRISPNLSTTFILLGFCRHILLQMDASTMRAKNRDAPSLREPLGKTSGYTFDSSNPVMSDLARMNSTMETILLMEE